MSAAKKATGQGAWRIFRWPLVIAIASTVGLISALVGDGVYDVLSWLLLGATLVVMAAAWRRGGAGSQAARPGGRPREAAAAAGPTRPRRSSRERSRARADLR